MRFVLPVMICFGLAMLIMSISVESTIFPETEPWARTTAFFWCPRPSCRSASSTDGCATR